MFRQAKFGDVIKDKTAEVAAVIAEEGLRYVSDAAPGYSRKRAGTSFAYYDKDGDRITGPDIIRRIKSIGIPPAYEAVWICSSPNGHIQATGFDARGRKQYRYDVNAYMKEITQQDFTAKDFRTWAGTLFATLALSEYKKYDSQAEAKRNVLAAIDQVAKQLGNSRAICRKCYVHPEILNAYLSGDLIKMADAKIADKFKRQYSKLNSDEIMVLAFLHKRLGRLKKAA
jgi:DNA topoisomerase IB